MEASTNLGRVSLVPKGGYDPSAQYERLDIVEHDGSSYLVLRPVQGVTPAAGSDYMLVAQRGGAGAVGETGPQGEQGIQGEQGPKGEKGDPGSSIASIERTSGTGAPGTTDTYTITLTDGSTSTFQVRNGADGQGAGDMTKSVYDPQGKNTDVFAYIDDAVKDVSAQDDLVTVPSGGTITVPETLGEGPYTFEFEEDGEGGAVTAADVSYDGSGSGLAAETVQGALDELSAGKADVGRVSNPNLLDNWYFARPVNQRGLTEYTDAGYTIDRWSIEPNMTLSVLPSGISISSSEPESGRYRDLFQTTEDTYLGETITFSVLTADKELITVTGIVPTSVTKFSAVCRNTTETMSLVIYVDDGSIHGAAGRIQGSIRILSDSTLVLIAAKLELGPVQTLAHQDADGSWVLNDPPPNRALELAKCQMCYWKSAPAGNYNTPSLIPAYKQGNYVVFSVAVNAPVTMRTRPAIKLNGAGPGENISIRNNTTGVAYQGVVSAGQAGIFGAGVDGILPVGIRFEDIDSFPMNSLYECTIELDANL